MAAGLTDDLLDITDIANMIEAAAPKPGKRSPSRKRSENSN
jgi:hypothetical protein